MVFVPFFLSRPPGAVTNVTAAVMVLMATNGKIPKDRSWKQAKMMMAKVDAFLDALINYDKEHIHSDVIKVNQTFSSLKKEEKCKQALFVQYF